MQPPVQLPAIHQARDGQAMLAVSKGSIPDVAGGSADSGMGARVTAGRGLIHGISAEALAHADRVAQEARALLHNDSDDEPPSSRLPHAADASLPVPSSLQQGSGACNGRVSGPGDKIATQTDAVELTLKLSSSSDQHGTVPDSTNTADPAGPSGKAVWPVAIQSQPPLTLRLTPVSSPTQSSAGPVGRAAAGPLADGEPLTLVLSPGSSREHGSHQQQPGAAAARANIEAPETLDLMLSSVSDPAAQMHPAGSSRFASAQPLAPTMPSGGSTQRTDSQPPHSSAGPGASGTGLLPRPDAVPFKAAQHSSGQQPTAPSQTAEAASANGTPVSGSPVITPDAATPAPALGMDVAGPTTAAIASNRTPEESPLHLAQRTPGPAPWSRVPPTPHTGAALRTALAPERTSGGSSRGVAGSGRGKQPAKRRMSSLLARASTDHAGTPTVGQHAAAADRARATAGIRGRHWGGQRSLPTLAEAPDGPGTVRLRNPPPTQVRRNLAAPGNT